jgi:cell division protein FtsZ
MQDDYVTIKGITLNRRKGSRLLTDMELEGEANFELQKRALEERASKLRSMSFNVNKADIEDSEDNIPAYQRRNVPLDTHPSSEEDTYSAVKITDAGIHSNINTLNTFLNGKNPD